MHWLPLLAALLQGCSYTAAASYHVGNTVSLAVTCTAGVLKTGTVQAPACTVSPSLPPGLSLDPTTCAISGSPTTVTAVNTYTVTLKDTDGTDTTVATGLTSKLEVIAGEEGAWSFRKDQMTCCICHLVVWRQETKSSSPRLCLHTPSIL